MSKPLAVPARFVGDAERALYESSQRVMSARVAALAAGERVHAEQLQRCASEILDMLLTLRGIRWSLSEPVGCLPEKPELFLETDDEMPDGRPAVRRLCGVPGCTHPANGNGFRCFAHAHSFGPATVGGGA